MIKHACRKGEIVILVKSLKSGHASRTACRVTRWSPKNIEIEYWNGHLKMYQRIWASPKSLIPATEPEKEQFRLLDEERRRNSGMAV